MGYGLPNESDFEHNHDFGYSHPPNWENPSFTHDHGFDTVDHSGLSKKTIIVNVIFIVIVILIILGLIYLCRKCCGCCKKDQKKLKEEEDDKSENEGSYFFM